MPDTDKILPFEELFPPPETCERLKVAGLDAARTQHVWTKQHRTDAMGAEEASEADEWFLVRKVSGDVLEDDLPAPTAAEMAVLIRKMLPHVEAFPQADDAEASALLWLTLQEHKKA